MSKFHISAIVAALLCGGGFAQISAVENVRLEAVEVKNSTGESVSDSGIGESFLQKDALFGPLMDKKIKDIPLQINVVTNELAQNLGASGLEGVWRTIPSATVSYMGSGSVARPGTRGMYGGVIGNNYWDRFMVTATTAVPMMIFDKLEVQNGLSGSLYGSQHPSGIYNYTRKRPVANQTIVRADWSEKANFGTMIDTSDKFEKVGYRGIFYFNDGEGMVDDSVKRSKLANLALDFYPTDDLTIETNFTYYNYIRYGYGGRVMAPQANGIARYAAPNAMSSEKFGLAQTWSGMDLESYNSSIKFKYLLSPDWYVEAGYQHHVSDRHTMEAQHTLRDNNGGVTTAVSRRGSKAPRFILQSWFVKAMEHEEFLGMEHDLGISTYGYVYDSKTALATLGNAISIPQNLANLQRYSKPNGFIVDTNLARALKFRTYNATLADDIKISKNFSLLLALTNTWVMQDSYANQTINGVTSRNKVGDNKDSEFTWLAGLTFRANDATNVYFTYSNSVQVDGLVPAAYDAGRTLTYVAPIKTEQYELGVKSNLGGVDLSAALFQIERPLYYRVGSTTTFIKQGKQRNNGLEFTAGGRLGEYVSFYGGAMLLNPKLKDTVNSYADGKYIVGAPRVQANLLLDFAVPNTNKLSLTTNLHYTGKRYIDDANTQSAPSYFTTDVGVRYATKTWFGKETTLRFNVNNLFDKKYWISVRPGESDGAGTGTTDMYLGDSRNFMASFEVKF